MVEVLLTLAEITMAADVGVLRHAASIKNLSGPGKDRLNDEGGNDWDADINGAICELAYAKQTNQYWGGHVNAGKAPDVGGMQVRSTPYVNGHLIVRPKTATHKGDDPNDTFMLGLVFKLPTVVIVGSMLGRDAMIEEFYRPADRKGPAAWWVPQNRLIPFVMKSAPVDVNRFGAKILAPECPF